MVPGSSLKGKIRTLLAKEYNTNGVKKPDEDAECLTRLFGSAKKDQVKRSRILISDMFLCNEKELREQGLQGLTEIKFENTISRATGVANPRQIERIVRGAIFGLDMMYEAEQEDEIIEDFSVLAEGLKLIQYDYLGGNGSRGYGKVLFQNVHATVVIGTIGEQIIETCNQLLQKTQMLGEE